MLARQWKSGSGVVKVRAAPIHRCMALRAILGITQRQMIRAGCGLVIVGVTRIARHAQARVDAGGVTLQTGYGSVRTGQRKFRLRVVVERRPQPVRGRMALRTILREACGCMRRVIRALPIFQMAGNARRIDRREVAPDVAGGARHRRVRSRQGEFGEIVIERGSVPIYGGVAHSAVLREPRGHVIGIIRALPILQVARYALCAQTGEHIVRVTNGASHGRMRPGQREFGLRRMVERGSVPVHSAVALGTVLRKAGGRVRRIIGSLPILQVA